MDIDGQTSVHSMRAAADERENSNVYLVGVEATVRVGSVYFFECHFQCSSAQVLKSQYQFNPPSKVEK